MPWKGGIFDVERKAGSVLCSAFPPEGSTSSAERKLVGKTFLFPTEDKPVTEAMETFTGNNPKQHLTPQEHPKTHHNRTALT